MAKSLQTILDEKSQYVPNNYGLKRDYLTIQRVSQTVAHDLEQMHTFLKQVAHKLDLELPPLMTSTTESNGAHKDESPNHSKGHHVPSRDNSPKAMSEDEGLPYVPIHSLYALTQLRALRSPDDQESQRGQGLDDFISRGSISLSDAERLFVFYRDRLDPYIYAIGCPYKSLHELRQKSQFLLVATLTVAALHDHKSDALYPICSSEFRRQVETSVFERRLDRDYLRALCVGSYWLSDLSWMLSGYAIRRAAEFGLHNSYDRAIENESKEDADCARLWYILYVCDQQLATLYGRPSIVQEDSSIQGVTNFLHSTVANEEDRRLLSQVASVSILRSIRELFSINKGKPLPRMHLNHISHFRKQLDQWFEHWTKELPGKPPIFESPYRNEVLIISNLEQWPGIGRFPRKGVILHYNFAQLYLYSHIFRGLSKDDPIPHYFLDCALKAISTATTIIDKFLNDPDVAVGIVGMPSYVHSMTAFACMFLTKVAMKYDDLIERERVYDLIMRLVGQFRGQPAGMWHLANLMITGLERMAQTLKPVVPVGVADMGQMSGVDNLFSDLAGDFFFDYDMGFGVPGPT